MPAKYCGFSQSVNAQSTVEATEDVLDDPPALEAPFTPGSYDYDLPHEGDIPPFVQQREVKHQEGEDFSVKDLADLGQALP